MERTLLRSFHNKRYEYKRLSIKVHYEYKKRTVIKISETQTIKKL